MPCRSQAVAPWGVTGGDTGGGGGAGRGATLPTIDQHDWKVPGLIRVNISTKSRVLVHFTEAEASILLPILLPRLRSGKLHMGKRRSPHLASVLTQDGVGRIATCVQKQWPGIHTHTHTHPETHPKCIERRSTHPPCCMPSRNDWRMT